VSNRYTGHGKYSFQLKLGSIPSFSLILAQSAFLTGTVWRRKQCQSDLQAVRAEERWGSPAWQKRKECFDCLRFPKSPC